MVKRQTVWLSTMMVLSLMLIGYYTMNNQTTPTSVGTGTTAVPTGDTVVGSSTSPTTVSGATTVAKNSSPASTTAGQTSTAAMGTTPMSATDWYVNTESEIKQNFSQKLDELQAIIANTSSSQSQLTSATQALNQLQDLQGNLENATEAVLSDGYKECVIVPDNNTGSTFNVYVSTSKLASTDAVKIMNAVSTTMDVPMANIRVSQR
jgi:stage III sporulation protein AH